MLCTTPFFITTPLKLKYGERLQLLVITLTCNSLHLNVSSYESSGFWLAVNAMFCGDQY